MNRVFVAAVVAAGTIFASSANAATLNGSFNLASLGDVEVGPDYIDWGEQGPAGPIFGPTDGDILFTSGSGDFGPGGVYNLLFGSRLGGLKDLSLADAPVNTPITIERFLTSDEYPELDFTLTFLGAGSGTGGGCGDTPGAVCTPFFGSPFTITNTNPVGGGEIGSSVVVNMSGTVSDGSGDPISLWTAAFTTQFADMSSGEILAMIDDEGFVRNSYSGTFVVRFEDTPSVPEPASMALMGLALSGMAFALRRRRS